MAEETNVVEASQQETQSNQLADALWGGSFEQPQKQENLGEQVATIAQENLETKEETPIEKTEVDYNAFVKENFGFDSLEIAKQEFENLKKPKEAESFKFSNEQSEKLFNALKEGKEDDVLDYLSRKKEVEKLSSAEVTKDTAVDILRLSLKSKNGELSNDEIDFLLNRKYNVGATPTQRIDELDEEFEVRKNEWNERANAVQKEMIIDAKLAKKDIEQLKSTIELPTLPSQNVQQQDNSKELEELEKNIKAYQSDLTAIYKQYDGVNVVAKCGDAELPITFKPTDAEKEAIKTNLLEFDINQYFIESRWALKDGGVNTQKLIDDYYFLENKDTILQKVANEAAAKMFEHIKKQNSNIKLNNEPAQTFTPQDRTEVQKLADAVWG